VNVEGPAPVVALGNAGKAQVPVEDLDQAGRHVEDGRIGRQPGRDRGAGLAGFLLQAGQLVGQPGAQVRGEVTPQGDGVALPVLLVGGIEGQVRQGVIEAQVRHGERSQLALAQPGQHERLVRQRPFAAQQRQPFAHFRPQVGVALALAGSLANRPRVEQRPLPGDGQYLDQLGFRHRPPLPPRVGLLVRPRYPPEGICGKPRRFRPHAPVGETDQRFAVGVAVARRHAFGGALGKPALECPLVEVGEPEKAAFAGNPVQPAPGILQVNPADSLSLQVLLESVEMLA
jgi:hypothetical protein